MAAAAAAAADAPAASSGFVTPARDRWFPCPGCDQMVVGIVKRGGPDYMNKISASHCCNSCAREWGHDRLWCAGVPGAWLKAVEVPDDDPDAPPAIAHALVLLPEGGSAVGPAPTLLWLHGAMTYVWPETMAEDLRFVREKNEASKNFVIIAPFATDGETLAEVSDWRRKKDRFGTEFPYVETFKIRKTWDCFDAICHALGPDIVDFNRRSVTGLSMGGQATWHVALRYGSQLAAIAPMAGVCKWPEGGYEKSDVVNQLRHVSVRAFSMVPDTGSFSWKDFDWIAKCRAGPERAFQERKAAIPEASSRNGRRKAADSYTEYRWQDLSAKATPSSSSSSSSAALPSSEGAAAAVAAPSASASASASASCRSCVGWDPASRDPPDVSVTLQLTLLSGGDDEHNCWDTVYSQEETFGLFTWLASCRRCHNSAPAPGSRSHASTEGAAANYGSNTSSNNNDTSKQSWAAGPYSSPSTSKWWSSSSWSTGAASASQWDWKARPSEEAKESGLGNGDGDGDEPGTGSGSGSGSGPGVGWQRPAAVAETSGPGPGGGAGQAGDVNGSADDKDVEMAVAGKPPGADGSEPVPMSCTED